jgi:hypothetical protein
MRENTAKPIFREWRGIRQHMVINYESGAAKRDYVDVLQIGF